MTNGNCYKCVYRDEVPGSALSSCHHPSNDNKMAQDPMIKLNAIFASVGRTMPMCIVPRVLGIKYSQHGLNEGWFSFPHMFDPTWIEEGCNGFTEAVLEWSWETDHWDLKLCGHPAGTVHRKTYEPPKIVKEVFVKKAKQMVDKVFEDKAIREFSGIHREGT